MSKQKKNITRDFSDGLLIAEIIQRYHPNIVEPHNYYNTNNIKKKQDNWNLLKKKVFPKMKFFPNEKNIQDIINCENFAIENFLLDLKRALQNNQVEKIVIRKDHSALLKRNKSAVNKNKSEIKNTKNNLREDKERITNLKEHIGILENKIKKMEEILLIKNEKISIMENKLNDIEKEKSDDDEED